VLVDWDTVVPERAVARSVRRLWNSCFSVVQWERPPSLPWVFGLNLWSVLLPWVAFEGPLAKAAQRGHEAVLTKTVLEAGPSSLLLAQMEKTGHLTPANTP
jgi:hypothetical protein